MNDNINNPDPNTKFPVPNIDTVCYVKPLVKNQRDKRAGRVVALIYVR